MSSKKSILFTGGGTAGHVIVNLALIPYFKKEGWKIDYVGSKNGIEKDLIAKIGGVTYHSISTGKLRRYISLENVKDPFKVVKGTLQAWNIIRKCKPTIVFSKGGFVSVPVVIAAKFRKVPTIIHESDLTPGLANKIATPFAKKILTTFPETIDILKKDKVTYVGAVIREELFQGEATKGLKFTKLDRMKPIILIMGGSIGSQKLNQVIRENLQQLLKQYHIIHICGKGNIDESIKEKSYVQFEYVSNELNDLFAITDYVISRAGANAIFEFLALRIPMLLIPLSRVASRGDQIDNARSFERNGYAHVLEEENLDSTTFLRAIERLKEATSVLIDHMKTYKSERAWHQVIALIESMSK